MIKKVIFEGAYGINSYGDDAPLVVMIDLLRQRIKDLECVVVARHIEEGQYANYGVRAISGLEYPSKKESVGKWFRGFNPDDDKTDLCRLYKEIAESDLLILGAGNFLVDYTIDLLKGPVSRFVVLSLMAKMTGTPVMWFGLSVGPLKTKLGKDLSRLAALLATSLTVRDEKSLRELSSLGIHEGVTVLPDPAYKIQAPQKGRAGKFPSWVKAHSDGKPVIAVSARTLPSGCGIENEKYLSLLAITCDLIVERMKANVLFIPQCAYTHGAPEEDDRNVGRQIINRMCKKESAFIVVEDLDVFDCLALYENALAAICTRLHGNVFAVIQGAPAIGLNYNPKVYEFFHWLGNEELVVEMPAIDPELLFNKVFQLINHRDDFVKKAIRRLDEGKKEIEKYGDLAVEAMKSKHNYCS